MLKLWEEFQKGVENKDINCDVITYNAAMKAAACCQSLSLAIDIYDNICSNNVEPECRTYSSLLVACAGEGDSEKVLWVLKEMKEHNVKPDLFVFNALLRAIRDLRFKTQNTCRKQNRETSASKEGSSQHGDSDNGSRISGRTEQLTVLDSNSTISMSEEDVGLDDNYSKANTPDDPSNKHSLSIPEVFTGVEDYLQLMAVNDVLPDVRTFHLLVQLAELEVHEEEYVLRVMKEWEIKPDLPVLNALVKRRALFGDVAKAQVCQELFISFLA
jgi:pentatricopeptide repeat protein